MGTDTLAPVQLGGHRHGPFAPAYHIHRLAHALACLLPCGVHHANTKYTPGMLGGHTTQIQFAFFFYLLCCLSWGTGLVLAAQRSCPNMSALPTWGRCDRRWKQSSRQRTQPDHD